MIAGMLLAPAVFFGAFIVLVWRMQSRLKRQGYRPRQQPPSRSVRYSFDPENSVKLRGGSRVGRANASVPLVTLTIDHEWAHLSGLVPVWIGRSEVEKVRPIKGTLGSGIMFDTPDGELDGTIFWTLEPPRVLAAFEWYRWPVFPG